MLLAMSLILQGYRTEAELSQLIGDISSDIRTDGVLNSPALGSALINDVSLFNIAEVRSNIESKYALLGVTTVIPDFEIYLTQFLDSNTYEFTNNITYPESGFWGLNILNTTDSILDSGSHSFCAILPEGTTLKVVWGGGNYGVLAFYQGSEEGWAYTSTYTYTSTQCCLLYTSPSPRD